VGVTIAKNAGVIPAVFASFVVFFYVSAHLDPSPSRIAVKQGFEDSTLNYDIYRLLEAVPGFIVTESDNAGAC